MATLETIYKSDKEIVEKYKEYAYRSDYNKLFFEHLGPELEKLYLNKKDKVITNIFFELSQYQYGFFGREINLKKIF